VDVPTLILVGERDLEDFHRIADFLDKGIPNAQKRVLPGVGHVSNMEDPQTFNEIVIPFVEASEG
jgi:pimeloyl-ACP methyl ester carboxylesterase